MLYLGINDFYNSNIFFKEPIENLLNQMHSKEIIITGNRGSGKSMLLKFYQSKSLNTDYIAIYTSFTDMGFFKEQDTDKTVMEHFYELSLCYRMYSFLAKYYPEIYGRYFANEHVNLNPYIVELEQYVNNFGDTKLSVLFNSGELVAKLLLAMKEVLPCDNFALLIDRFDWTDDNNPMAQNLLYYYASLFSSFIITSDDIALSEEETGFQVLTLDYGKKSNYARELLRRYVYYSNLFGKSERHLLYPDSINQDLLNCLINEANGNIDILFEVYKELHFEMKKNILINDLLDLIKSKIRQRVNLNTRKRLYLTKEGRN